MAYLIRNYNRFLMKTEHRPFEWVNLYIHRFPHDFKKLVTFDSEHDANEFLKKNPDLEANFNGWVLPADPEAWQGLCPWGK